MGGPPIDKGVYYLQKQNSCLTEDYPDLAKDVPDQIQFATDAFGLPQTLSTFG